MAERAVHFSPGEEVEVGNSEKGFKGSWYAARVLRKIDRPYSRSASKTTKKKVFVEYQTLMADKKGAKPLRESVNISTLRPKRPPLPQEEEEEEADRSNYQVDEKVEAFDHDGWWEGIVTKVLEDQRYRVYFEECDEEFEYHKSLLRRHFEWVDGRWVCEAVAHDEQQTMKPMFTKGDSVEVRVDSEICGDAWFPATVLKQTSNKRFLVELQISHENSFQLLETVDSQHIRPLPPQMVHVNAFQLSEKVDALYEWRWWSGVINRILSGGRYVVFFKHQNKLKEFVHSDLRFHMDWVDGKWFRDSKEVSITPHDQAQNESPGHVQSGQAGNSYQNTVLNSQLSLDAAENVAAEKSPEKVQSRQDKHTFQTDMANSGDASKNLEAEKSPSSFRIPNMQTLEPIFSRERLVEVCLDGDTCYGAWFPATVLKEIDNNHVLVEFQKLRSRARGGILKETVESRYIRPFPPQTCHVKSYELLDKVDAFDDGGWWSGLIKRILAGSRYTVSFKHQNKLKEFSHSEMRIHMDWTNGQWSENFKGISVARHNQCGTESFREALSEEAVNTDQIIDLVSPLGLDATKNVAVKTLPIQTQTQQDRKTFQCTDIAHPSSGNAVKTVASKKSHSPRISRKVEYRSSSKKSCSTGKAHSGDAAKKISSEKSPSCLSGKEVKAPISLIACPVRGMPMGSSAVNENFLAHCSKDHPEPLNSSQDKKKHDLESNGARNLHSVAGCSSHLPYIIDMEEDQVVDSPKLQTLARQMKLDVQTPRQKRKPLGGDDIEQQEMEGVSKQKMNAFDRRGQAREEVLDTKATVKGGERQAGKSQAHDARIETQTEGHKHTSASKTTTTFVVKAEDKYKEIEMDGASKGNRDSDQHISMCIEESYFPSSIYETGVSSANQPMVQAMEADVPMRGLELQSPLNVTDNSYPLEGTIVVNQPDEAIGDEHYERVMQSFLSDNDIPLEDEGVSFDNQPTAPSVKAITWKDSPVRGPELRNYINVDVSSFSCEGANANTLMGRAIGDEDSDYIEQSFLINSTPDQMLIKDESLPFIKCSPVWEIVESWEVFRVMPQKLHFRPLEEFNMELREGHALGSMVNFANIVEKVGKAKLDDPPSTFQKWSNALENLKSYGFNVQPIQARLETLLRIKDEQAKFNEELMEAEGQTSMILAEKISIEAELDEHNKKIRELEECLNQLIKKQELTVLKKEVQDSSIAELKKTIDNARKCIQRVTSEFRTVVATPW